MWASSRLVIRRVGRAARVENRRGSSGGEGTRCSKMSMEIHLSSCARIFFIHKAIYCDFYHSGFFETSSSFCTIACCCSPCHIDVLDTKIIVGIFMSGKSSWEFRKWTQTDSFWGRFNVEERTLVQYFLTDVLWCVLPFSTTGSPTEVELTVNKLTKSSIQTSWMVLNFIRV